MHYLVLLTMTPLSAAWSPLLLSGKVDDHQVMQRLHSSSRTNSPRSPSAGRREFVSSILAGTATTTAATLLLDPEPAAAATAGLADRLASRDPANLANSIFNRPPAGQVFPNFMAGSTWDVTSRFGGYLFPSTKISKQAVLSRDTTPGFQKCSIAATADIGKEGDITYGMRILENGLEDRVYNLQQQIDAYLGYKAVSKVLYDAKANPNRISIDFVDYKTRNAERIELFCNGRESELSVNPVTNKNVFVCSEYIRQVTFGGGTEVGIPRQVVANYGHFWTWRKSLDDADGDTLTGNLLTAAYLDPQDPLFFDEPVKPVAVYSHILKATRRRT
jgi:hypothetical protein